jgi:hypothetical protein
MKSWQEIYDEVPMVFNRKDEQALTEAFEDFVGGSQNGFQLMRIHTCAKQSTSGNQFTFRKTKNTYEVFVEMAKKVGFTEEHCDAFYDLP